jgi:FkbH-like protein
MNIAAIKNFTALKKNLKKEFSGLTLVNVALLGDSATQLLAQAIQAYGYELGIKFDVWEADYDQVERQILDISSDLYKLNPEFVIIFQSSQKLVKKFQRTAKDQRVGFATSRLDEVRNYYSTLKSHTKAKIIYFNYAELNDSVFGSYSNKTESSFVYQLRKINFGLMDLAIACKDLFICDYNLLNATFGHTNNFDPKMYYSADIVTSLDVLPWVAKRIGDIIASATGKFKKCLILDLDNTIWGGIIGDDGIENIQVGDLGFGKAFTELQLWVKQLKERGIIIAVCSKNEEQTAKLPFEQHPDMVLRLEDIAVFVANWNNKADNIRYIQSILNIGFDSMVFLDDNPVEREMVRTNLLDVTVPELPEDPAGYMSYLTSLNLFETTSYSDEDENRNRQYREEAGRVIAQKNFTNEDDFLISLDMTSEVRPFNKFNTPRVAQLSQRSNQFNLRTVRYSEDDVQRLAASGEYITLTFNLKDKFGDNGLISIITLQKRAKEFFIENWLMSCRVLKRGMENFTLNAIVERTQAMGADRITGEFIPTAKNMMVKDHYEKLGFKFNDGLWILELVNYEPRKCFIKSV